MALSINSTSGSIQTVAGRYVEYSVTVDSTTSLVGQNLFFAVGLDTVIITNPANLPNTGWKLTNYTGTGLEAAIFYGNPPDNNLEIVVDKVSNVQFVVYYRWLMSADPGDFPAEGMANENHFTRQDNGEVNLYSGTSRKVHIKIFETDSSDNIQNSLNASDNISASWYLPFGFGENQTFAIAHGTNQGKSGYSCTENTVVTFNINTTSLGGSPPANIEMMLFKKVDDTATSDPVTEMDINYAVHLSGSKNPLLPIAAFVSSALNVGGAPYFDFDVEIDSNYFDGSSRYYLVISFTVSGTPLSALIELRPNCGKVPTNVTVGTGVTEDLTFATTYLCDCILEIPECYTELIFSAMLKSTYNTELAALGLLGNFDDNFVGVNYYITNELPLDGEAIAGTPTPVDYLDDVVGQKVGTIEHMVPQSEPYYIVFEWVFTQHKIYNPIFIDATGTGIEPFENLRIEDSVGDPVGLCYDYDDDISVYVYYLLSFGPRSANTLLLHSKNGGDFIVNDVDNPIVSITDVPSGGGDGEVLFDVDRNNVIAPINCFKYLTWGTPFLAAPTDTPFNVTLFQVTLENDRFEFFVNYASFYQLDIGVYRDGILIEKFLDVEDSTSYEFEAEIRTLNRFVFKAMAYRQGSFFENEISLDTNNVYLDVSSDVIVLS